MPDLVEKFFNEDLTEAETAALRGSLSASGETAERFGELAEGIYRACGLPEPQWAGPEFLKPAGKLGFGAGFWTGVLTAALLAGFAGWHFLGGAGPGGGDPGMRKLPAAAPGPSSMPGGYDAPAEEVLDGPKDLEAPAAERQVPEAVRVPIREEAPAAKGSLSAEPVVPTRPSFDSTAPINLDLDPNRNYSNLSVEVVWPGRKDIAVRVLDANGAEVVSLYRGLLEPGRWVFDWNGKSSDGRPAPAGEYQIEVRSGMTAKRKGIRIK
jgi:hypothetical protein